MLSEVVGRLVGEGELQAATADELLKCWTPVQSLLPGYSFLSNPWETDDEYLKQVVLETTQKATKQDYPTVLETDYGFQREVAWAGAGIIDGVSTWCRLNEGDAYTLLADENEAAVVNRVFESSQTAGVEAFSAIASARIPNLKSISWERVLELRHHPHLEKFRSKLSSLEVEVRKGDTLTVTEVISEIELSDLRRLALLVEPSLKSSIVKAVVSNIPMPIPMNPISVALGAKDVANAHKIQKSFGWLYFLIELSQTSW
jgi:hypothetical protein